MNYFIKKVVMTYYPQSFLFERYIENCLWA